jgi:hypothetical protein
MTDEPDDERNLFTRGAAAKAARHRGLLVALGVAVEREPDGQAGDEGEREVPRTPAA